MAARSKTTVEDLANLEDLTIIWVDEYSQDLNAQRRLRSIINCLKVFTHIDSFLDYIQSVPNEHLYVVVSGALSAQVIPVVQNLSQVLHAYVFCPNNEKHPSISSRFACYNQESLYQQLSHDVNHFYATHSIPISLSQKSLRDLTHDAGDFFWF